MLARSLTASAIVVFAALTLTGCMIANPFERQSARNRWLQDFVNERYGSAAGRLRGPGIATWETEAGRLRQAHGKVRSVQSDDLVGWQNEPPFTSVRVTWTDGHERCLRYRQVGDDQLELLDGGWQDCANVPFNPTPPPGP